MGVTLDELDALRAKYEEMLAMRVTHEAGDDGPDVRERMAKLAAPFPGALREIDELDLEEIRRRVRSLELVLRGEGPVLPWMEAMALFHTLARGALCAKRWLGGRKHVDDATRAGFARESSALAYAEDARRWTDELHRIAAPPGGRLTDVVFARVAAELGLTAQEARVLVFGGSRREV